LQQKQVSRWNSIDFHIASQDRPSKTRLDFAPECCLLKEPCCYEFGRGLWRELDIHKASPKEINKSKIKLISS